jgi:hypothetical protein
MALVNWLICGGLSLSGALMLLGLTPGREGLLGAHFFGYWFGLAAALVYVVHGGIALFRSTAGFWVVSQFEFRLWVETGLPSNGDTDRACIS